MISTLWGRMSSSRGAPQLPQTDLNLHRWIRPWIISGLAQTWMSGRFSPDFKTLKRWERSRPKTILENKSNEKLRWCSTSRHKTCKGETTRRHSRTNSLTRIWLTWIRSCLKSSSRSREIAISGLDKFGRRLCNKNWTWRSWPVAKR